MFRFMLNLQVKNIVSLNSLIQLVIIICINSVIMDLLHNIYKCIYENKVLIWSSFIELLGILNWIILVWNQEFLLVSRELLLQNTRLTVPILDALSNLNLRPEILSEVSFFTCRLAIWVCVNIRSTKGIEGNISIVTMYLWKPLSKHCLYCRYF